MYFSLFGLTGILALLGAGLSGGAFWRGKVVGGKIKIQKRRAKCSSFLWRVIGKLVVGGYAFECVGWKLFFEVGEVVEERIAVVVFFSPSDGEVRLGVELVDVGSGVWEDGEADGACGVAYPVVVRNVGMRETV